MASGTIPSPIPVAVVTPIPPVNNTVAWEVLAPGLERRIYRPHGSNVLTQLLVVRIDTAQYQFRVHYQPDQPLNVRQWREVLPGAIAFVNGNFYDAEYRALGLIAVDGVVYGTSFAGYGGMFQIQDGQARVRSNFLEPYNGETLEQAVQGFPMLVLNGTQGYTDTRRDEVSRRTVVGQDTSGRILLMVTPLVGIGLVELSAYLPTTDMELVNAVNLDGGGSTMLYLNVPGIPEYLLRSFDAVPAGLAVYPGQD
jgi:uncharacterized protein YigE (DUF2233 family)